MLNRFVVPSRWSKSMQHTGNTPPQSAHGFDLSSIIHALRAFDFGPLSIHLPSLAYLRALYLRAEAFSLSLFSDAHLAQRAAAARFCSGVSERGFLGVLAGFDSSAEACSIISASKGF